MAFFRVLENSWWPDSFIFSSHLPRVQPAATLAAKASVCCGFHKRLLITENTRVWCIYSGFEESHTILLFLSRPHSSPLSSFLLQDHQTPLQHLKLVWVYCGDPLQTPELVWRCFKLKTFEIQPVPRKSFLGAYFALTKVMTSGKWGCHKSLLWGQFYGPEEGAHICVQTSSQTFLPLICSPKKPVCLSWRNLFELLKGVFSPSPVPVGKREAPNSYHPLSYSSSSPPA